MIKGKLMKQPFYLAHSYLWITLLPVTIPILFLVWVILELPFVIWESFHQNFIGDLSRMFREIKNKGQL